jgi:hypothetical protein
MGVQYLIVLIYALSFVSGNLLSPGIIRKEVTVTQKKIEYYGFFQSALNGSEVGIRLNCENDIPAQYSVQYVLRSTPCAKEFTDKTRLPQMNNLLEFYFNNENEIPNGFHYDSIYFYKSATKNFSCDKANGVDVFLDEYSHPPMQLHNVTEYGTAGNKVKREALLNGNSIDGGAKRTLTSWHPAQILPASQIYVLIVKIAYAGSLSNQDTKDGFKILLEVQVSF